MTDTENEKPKPPTKHIVMYSGGAGSWATAQRVKDKYGIENLWLVFADIKGNSDNPHAGEDEDNYRFIRETAKDLLEDRYDTQMVWIVEGRTIWDVFKDNRYLGNSRLANCSKFLKQIPCRQWLVENAPPENSIVYVGIDWSESHRVGPIVKAYLPWKAECPMTEEPYLDKEQVLQLLRDKGIEPPRLYSQGFAHANCGGFCVRSGQAQFAHLLKINPERYKYHEDKEQELRAYLDKDVSILKDRRGGTTTPLTLLTFRERIEQEEAAKKAKEAAQPSLFDENDWGGCGCFVSEESENLPEEK